MARSYDKAVQLLAVRPHFRRELEAKLRQRGFPSEDIEETLGRLTDQGYLDDRAAARSFVEGRAGKGEGRVRLRAELREAGGFRGGHRRGPLGTDPGGRPGAGSRSRREHGAGKAAETRGRWPATSTARAFPAVLSLPL